MASWLVFMEVHTPQDAVFVLLFSLSLSLWAHQIKRYSIPAPVSFLLSWFSLPCLKCVLFVVPRIIQKQHFVGGSTASPADEGSGVPTQSPPESRRSFMFRECGVECELEGR